VSCLFICHQPIAESACRELQQLLSEDDGLLLIEDAVYLARTSVFNDLSHCYLLKTDMMIRGLGQPEKHYKIINDYSEMVALTLEYDKCLTWSV
jgi:sulfur relay protein TusB/DsrH